MRKELVICIFAGAVALLGCETRNKGTLEKAGERTDEIIDNVKDGENPLKKKGALEKAGEAIDDTINGGGSRR